MQLEIKRIHQELGGTVVYVTHEQGEALAMSCRMQCSARGASSNRLNRITLERMRSSASFIGENSQLHGTVFTISDETGDVEIAAIGAVRALAINIHASPVIAPPNK